jgi:hypothetical protein
MSQSGTAYRAPPRPSHTPSPPPPPPPMRPPPPAPHGKWPPAKVIGIAGAIAVVIGAVVLAGILVQGNGDKAKPPAALSAARLSGSFTVTERMTWARGTKDWKAGTVDHITWQFAPTCKDGACAARLRFTVGSVLSGDKAVSIKLARSGAVYRGSGKASLSSCQLQPIQGRLRVWLRVTRGAWIDGEWTATRVRGTVGYSSPEASFGLWTCQAGGYTARMTGLRD